MRITGAGVWGPPPDRQEAIAVLRYHRRFSGDARVRNPIVDALYKGA